MMLHRIGRRKPGEINFMIYGELQYYHDELTAWLKIMEFHKAELHELLTQLNVILNFPVVSLPDTKACNMFIDKLMVQEQQFDHLCQHFAQQVQRLEHAIVSPESLAPSIVQSQTIFRNKIRTFEMTFIKTRYDCSVFLCGFFHPTERPLTVI
jgi:hypothetical protein